MISNKMAEKAQAVAKSAIASFEGAGIFGVELFLLEDGETVLLNECAPLRNSVATALFRSKQCLSQSSPGITLAAHLESCIGIKHGQLRICSGSTQKHITIHHEEIPRANHFFEKEHDEMMAAVDNYLDFRLDPSCPIR